MIARSVISIFAQPLSDRNSVTVRLKPSKFSLVRSARSTTHTSCLSVKSCPFFEKCLRDTFHEGSTREVSLEEEHVTAFDQFVLWIYNQPLTMEHTWALAVTYTLADQFLMEALKNAVVDRAIHEF
jgi:hypothetical protein